MESIHIIESFRIQKQRYCVTFLENQKNNVPVAEALTRSVLFAFSWSGPGLAGHVLAVR